MKKLFIAICFIALSCIQPVEARIKEVLDIKNVPQPQQQPADYKPKNHTVSEEDFDNFIIDRLSKTVIVDADKVSTEGIYVEPSEQAQRQQAEQNKSEYEKIYEQAMQRATSKPQANTPAASNSAPTPMPLPLTPSQAIRPQARPKFPVIDIALPFSQEKIMVPAQEHIPYLRSDIDILPDGKIKFAETIVAVNNGQKLKDGLIRVLPAFTVGRDKQTIKAEYAILDVSVNGQSIPYKLRQKGNFILLEPRDKQPLPAGVYTYNIQYVGDKILHTYNDFTELYWNIVGEGWNLVITRAAAKISFAPEIKPLGFEAFSGAVNHLSADKVGIYQISPHSYGMLVDEPIYLGSGVHLMTAFASDALMPPDFDTKMLDFFTAHSDTLISLLTLVMIWVSFRLSWKYIRQNKGQLKISLAQNAPLTRYLATNKIDMLTVGSFLLDLYRRNIIDIQQADDTILLIKRTDSLKGLSSDEQKSVHELFGKNDAVLNACKANMLKFKRVLNLLRKDIYKRLWQYLFKKNSGYVLFSCGMLFIGELFMAYLQINQAETLKYLCGCSIATMAGCLLCLRHFTNRWLGWIIKISGVCLLILPAVLIAANFISLPAIICILLSIIIIVRYISSYAQRNGLLKEAIEKSQKSRLELLDKKEAFSMGRNIISQQPVIMALELGEEFCVASSDNEHNKLGVMLNLMQKLH